MRAVQISETGGPEVLQVVDLPEPHAAAGQVRVSVRGAGVNPVDWKVREGLFPVPLPAVLGWDAAGVVDEVGDAVTGTAVGDEVFGLAPAGAYAELAVLVQWAHKPAGMAFEEAAGLPVSAETAVRTLDLLGVRDGTVLLVNGAAGGVGLILVQFALARGATVVGTASEGNHDDLRALGALPTTYGPGLPDRVRALVPRIDGALDAAGQGALPDLIEVTGSPDRVVTIADPTAQEHGVRFSSISPGTAAPALREAARLAADGQLRLPVAGTFALDRVRDAHVESQTGHVHGKLVLVP